MASKRTTARKPPSKRRKLTKTQLIKRYERAQAEVAKLLKRHRGGTLTRVDLKAGLDEIEGQLRLMEPHDWYFHR
jgi:hypothetical protein